MWWFFIFAKLVFPRIYIFIKLYFFLKIDPE
jgi:hypothetical protein